MDHDEKKELSKILLNNLKSSKNTHSSHYQHRVNSAPDVLLAVVTKCNKKKHRNNKSDQVSQKNRLKKQITPVNTTNYNRKESQEQNNINNSNIMGASQSSLNVPRYAGITNSHIGGSRRESKSSDRFLSISRTLSMVSGGGERRLSSMEQHREKFESQFCRIRVLLISMQLGLGLSMSGLGIYLRSVSVSLTWADCTYWAGIPLLFCGACGLYFCLTDVEIQKRIKITRLVKAICTIMSLITAGLTLLASITSGSHGKWISDYSSSCDLHFIKEHSPTSELPDKCCIDGSKSGRIAHLHYKPLANETRCLCKYQPFGNMSLQQVQRYYDGLSCRYVFSALKDYFILQSSLMMVASGVCIWLVLIQLRSQPTLIKFNCCCGQYYNNHSNMNNYYLENNRQNESPSPNFLEYLPQYSQQHNYPDNLLLSSQPMTQNSSINNSIAVPKVIIHEAGIGPLNDSLQLPYVTTTTSDITATYLPSPIPTWNC